MMNRDIFRNEFASVEVGPDNSANGCRLLIRDLYTGREVYLDPLELEAVTRIPHNQFAHWLDPDAHHEDQGPATFGNSDSPLPSWLD